MKRVFLKKHVREVYFKKIKDVSRISWSILARKLGYSERNLFDWRIGKYSMPKKVITEIENLFSVFPKELSEKSEYWHTKMAGRLGAVTRNKKYGNPGTKKGRKKGGERSMITHKRDNTGFVIEKNIVIPRRSTILSEFIGIVLGDGSISNYQVTIYLNLSDDYNYALSLISLVKDLFGIDVSVLKRKEMSVIALIISSKQLVKFLVGKNDLTIGNKVKNQIRIPSWIMTKKCWQAACLRGLFDTDGCVYLDNHVINKKVYKNLGLVFSSSSRPLLEDINASLIVNCFSPTDSHGGNKIMLRRENEITRFFAKIKPRNPKHTKRFRKFMRERYRSGHNGTASKAVRD